MIFISKKSFLFFPFCFSLIEFLCTFSISCKILPCYIYFRACFTFHTRTSLFTFLVCFFILFHSSCSHVPVWKHSSMSCSFPLAILNGTMLLLSEAITQKSHLKPEQLWQAAYSSLMTSQFTMTSNTECKCMLNTAYVI